MKPPHVLTVKSNPQELPSSAADKLGDNSEKSVVLSKTNLDGNPSRVLDGFPTVSAGKFVRLAEE